MEEATKTKVLSTLRIIGDKPPGREVLFPANYCQRFDEGNNSFYLFQRISGIDIV